MRPFGPMVLAAALGVAVAPVAEAPARADPIPAPVPGPEAQALQGVISDQIRAFLADDVATAFGFASPGIRGVFGTPERFGAMVRGGYPMVWRPGAVRFLDLEGTGTVRRQVVEITDRAGRVHLLEYSMVATAEGWRIDGVRLLPAPPPVA